VSAVRRALKRLGFVLKKRPRPSKAQRADVAEQRQAFLEWMTTVNARRLVFLDESGANLAMGGSHAWIRRGEEYIEPRPMNWGTNLTLIGAVWLEGWVTLDTMWKSLRRADFIDWVRDRLAPRLRPGDIVLLDNLPAHNSPVAHALIEARGATVKFLPPYSPDFNPIEAAWALVKKFIRAFAPRTADRLRRTAGAARHAVRPYHCERFFSHAGYVTSTDSWG
jgi:transposase